MSQPNVKVVEYHRLSSEEFARLRAKLPQPVVTADTNPQQVGWLLGIQYCLDKVREGVVIE
jgi:hypothetical protein